MSSTSSQVLRADKIWLDGKFIKWDEGQVHIMTHALHYGLGVFEGIRAYKTHDGRLAIFRLREHIRRFYDSAHICMLKLPYTRGRARGGVRRAARGSSGIASPKARTCGPSPSWATAPWAWAR